MNYSYRIGRFEKRRALEFFSQGVCMAVISGVVYALILMILREPILSWIAEPGAIRNFAGDYYGIILISFLMSPLSLLLDSLLVADGGEKLSAVANTVQIAFLPARSVFIQNLCGPAGSFPCALSAPQ